MYYVPLLGQQVGILQLLRGETVTAAQTASCVVTGLVVALLAMVVTAWVYRSERLAISA
jgi:sodium transport system permease protein